MDFGFSEQQEMFRTSVRDALEREYPMDVVREVEEKKIDYSREFYAKMAQMGWLGLMIPEQYGGESSNWIDAAILYEEAGKALLSSPHLVTVILGGQAILNFGSEEQKGRLLPAITQGEIVVTWALAEPGVNSDLSLIATKATSLDDGYTISGTKLFVPFAHLADYLITACRGPEGEIILPLVGGTNGGLTSVPLDTIGGSRLDEVTFDEVRIDKGNKLGKASQADIDQLVSQAKVLSCAEMVGIAQAALDMAIWHAEERVQFGRPIASFQTIQHKMADMSLAVQGARHLVYYTVRLLSEGIACAKERAMTCLYVGPTCNSVVRGAMHIHGGVGLSRDHNITLFYRRAKAIQLNLGYSELNSKIIAQELGL